VLREQGVSRYLVGEVLHDRIRFPEREVAVDQGRHPTIRVQCEVLGPAQIPGEKIKVLNIEKSGDPENKRRYLYRLTDKGLDLAPVLLEMIRWSAKYDADSGTPQEFLDMLENDMEGLIKKVREGMQI
jgi:hypothetical protein